MNSQTQPGTTAKKSFWGFTKPPRASMGTVARRPCFSHSPGATTKNDTLMGSIPPRGPTASEVSRPLFATPVGILFLSAMLGLSLVLPEAHATGFKIRVTEFTDDTLAVVETPAQVVTDNGVGDFSGLSGLIGSFFTTTNFQVVGMFGTSQPLGQNSPYLNRLDLSNVNVSSPGEGGTLLVEITDTGFSNAPMAALGGSFTTSIGGTLGTNSNTIQVESYWDANNAPFGMGELLSSLGTFTGPGAFSEDDVVYTAPSLDFYGPFSLTQRLTISMAADDIISYDSELIAAVPEPSTMLLLGSGLVGLIGYRRKMAHA